MPKDKFADLHLHTIYSDGTFSPGELMQRALAEGIDCIAITDHDTLQALPETFKDRPENLEVISGIELSCDWKEREVHLLGYFLDYRNKKLLARLDEIRKQRIERIYLMVDKLKNLNVNISADDVFNMSKIGTVGRLHLAKVLLEKKIVSSINEAFTKYIGEGRPAYEGRFRMGVEEAIKIILVNKAVPVLAHPCTINDDDFIKGLVRLGIKGLEVYYPEHSPSQVEHYKGLCQELGLTATGGSDCHGIIKENIKIGSVRIPYSIVESLKRVRDEISA